MKVVWAALLLAHGVSTAAAMDSSNSIPRYKLDMAPNSVDDEYSFLCDGQMKTKVKDEYLQNERNKDKDFKKSWDAAVAMYDAGHNKKITVLYDPKAPHLTRDKVIGIYAYTSAPGSLYKAFNDEVRTKGPQYKTDFKFHALHYYLTKAIQHLKVSKCSTVYRRTKVDFDPAAVNSAFRFGFFASSSKLNLQSTRGTAANFGSRTCFEIITCMGGNVFEYAKYEREAEVLIPPYEVFKVTSVQTKVEKSDLECDVVYKIKSTGKVSNYNCALF